MRTENKGAIIEDSIRADVFKKAFAQIGKSHTLLDLGCGARPYLSIYEPYFEKTLGADLPDSPFEKYRVDIYCSATEIPLGDNEIDVVFAAEVMHDISEPDKMLREIFRILKPGGTVILSSPFMVPICDGKYDHYRYTKYGLQYLFSEQKFFNIKITEVGNLFAVIIQLCVKPHLRLWNRLSKILHLPFLGSLWNPFIFIFIFLPQAIYYMLYKLSKRIKLLYRMGMKYSYSPVGYVVYAVKPR